MRLMLNLQHLKPGSRENSWINVDGQEVLQGHVYDFEELRLVDEGIRPQNVEDEEA